uniref:Uncharacterized protein YPO0396 n=1 Tax=Candidatus Kentrum sp. FM TaxID=2126340 RepID=A0A450VN44_9GAMM|nr:MAG: Uncharacterized protein YPO0396 [Candidatus Kentron sp. FM]VFJ44357.1 MAG: Uncharacterized protein YPO0396 [Candidatus Kentron sp. FM]VFK06229.1 MAG: Uncharacterized protein YPO0396 [Candidatus Kentron sp. FM]
MPDRPDTGEPAPPTGFRLTRLEVLNWGTFDAKVWGLDLAGGNTLLTGDIGSGKSTLVDAVTSLLVPHNRINYNKAAGADTRERDLRSYVLGYYKSEKGETGGSARPVALRDHNSYSVILGHFRNVGFDSDVTLAQVFWLKDHVGQPERFYVVSDGRLSITGDFGGFGPEIAALKKRLKAKSGLQVFESFPPYGAAFRRRFGIETEQAIELFHQTVSMKSVGNLTGFVRTHMLEPFDVGSRIKALVAHFDDLTRAHEAVLKARRQIELLNPLITDCDKHDEQTKAVGVLRECRDMLHPWFSGLKAQLLVDRLERLDQEIGRLAARVAVLTEQQGSYRQQQREIEKAIAANGGDRLQELREAIAKAERERDDRQRRARDYDAVIAELKFPAATDADAFQANLGKLEKEREAAEARQADAQNRIVERGVDLQAIKKQHEPVVEELDSLRRRPSNIPKRMLDLRQTLCHATGLPTDGLPFVGELIQVRAEAADWEGAAERLLHGFALSLLVPDARYAQIADWVDRTHLHGRLVYFRVRGKKYPAAAAPAPESLVRKLTIKADSAFYGWLERELAKRFDYVCCETMEQFRREPRAVTRAGQKKDGNERHEKDDRRRIDDRTGFVLGWSNAAKIMALETRESGLVRQMQEIGETISSLQQELKEPGVRLQQLSKLETWTDFRDLDWRSATGEIERLEGEKRAIEADSDVLRALEEQLATVTKDLDRISEDLTIASNHHAVAANKKLDAGRALDDACGERDGAPEETRARCFPLLEKMRPEALGERKLTVQSCDRAEQDMREWLQKKKIDAFDARIASLQARIIKAMTGYMTDYPLKTREADATLASAPEYRRMRDDLVHDGLPRFEADFKRQLNENAIREIANFQSQLNRENGDIVERVDVINYSLADIDYNPGRFIRLEAEQTHDTEIRAFRQDLRACTEGTLTGSEDEAYSEAKFEQVKRIVERFRGREGTGDLDKRWTGKVTDVRNWFLFSASERWREDGTEYEHYTDSGGKSGGQKEKLAYTVLAASLAYQFGLDWGHGPSRSFRFVVIDEAFGRGSDESTRYGLELFRRLDLQLLIVTPLQKIHIIEPFVSGVGFVHNPKGERSFLRNLTIEEFRAERDARRLSDSG